MKWKRASDLLATAALGLALAACGSQSAPSGTEGGASDSTGPSIRFADLTDGAEVMSPAEVCVEATGMTIEAAGEIKAGSGHHHLVIDPTEDETAMYTGESTTALPKDDRHLHLGDGTSCFQVELTPGEHTLMTVVADAGHVPLNPPVVASVNVTVK